MSVQLTEQELKELKNRFNSIIVNESVANDIIVHTLSNGKIVKGVVNSENVLQVKSVSEFLCG